MIGKIEAAFAAKYPDIKLDAGTGKLMAQVAAKRKFAKPSLTRCEPEKRRISVK